MASVWTPFQETKPVTSDTRQQAIDYIKNNEVAIWAMLGGAGMVPGWDMEAVAGTGTASQPQYVVYTYDTTIQLRQTFTWGNTGGEDGNATKIVYEFSDDTGSTWDEMADKNGNYVQTITYDGDGNVTEINWGNTP